MLSIAKNDHTTFYRSKTAIEYNARDFYKTIEQPYGSVAINKIERHGDAWVVMYTHRVDGRVLNQRVAIVTEVDARLRVKGDYVC